MNMENKIKQNLPKGWRKVKLGKLLKVETGRRPSGGVLSIKSGIPSIGAEHLNDRGGFNLSSLKYIPADYFKKSTRGKIKENDILVVKDGATIGKVSRVSKYFPFFKAMVNEHVFIVRSSNENLLNQTFLFYKLFSHEGKEMIKSSISGSAQGGLKKDFLDHWETYIPPLSIQKRIADILSAFDEKIELNNRINQILEEMAQAIFKHWFVDFKFPGHEKAKSCSERSSTTGIKFVDSELGKIPEGWKVKNIMEIIKRLPVGKRYDNKTALPKGKVPILDQGQSGIIGFHNDEPSIKADVKNPVAVFSNHTCYYRLITFDFSCIQNVIPYIGVNGYPTLFVYYLTKDKVKISDYKGHWPEFTAQKFIVPPPKLAVKFSEKIQPFIELIHKNKVENQKLSALRDLLLPKLMSGEVRV